MKKAFILLTALICALAASATTTVDINVTKPYVFQHNEASEECPNGDWYIAAQSEDGNYLVRIDYLGAEKDKYGTFSLADLNPDASYIMDFAAEETGYYYYKEGTTVTVSQKDGHDVVEATLVCDNGVTYNFHAEYIPSTISIEGTEITSVSSYDGEWYIDFQNDKYTVSLDLLPEDGNLAGTYTADNSNIDWCSVRDNDTYDSEYFQSMNVEITIPAGVTDPLKGCEITGTAVGENGNVYNFHMLVDSPLTPTDTIDVAASVKTAEWISEREDCRSYFELSDNNSPQLQWNLGLNKYLGEFNEDYIASALTKCIDTESGDILTFDHGMVTETLDPNTLVLHVSAVLVMSDSKAYRLVFDYQVECKGNVDYNFTNISTDDSYYEDYGIQYLNASNDDASFSLMIYGDIPGTYNDKTAYAEITFNNEDGTTTEVDGISIFNATSSLDESNRPVLVCRFIGNDMKVYNINACFKVPDVKDTLTVDIDGLKVAQYFEEEGVFEIYGYNSDRSMFVDITPDATQFAGHYTMEDLLAHSVYNYLVLISDDGSFEQNFIYAADFDVTQDGAMITLTGQFQAGAHWVNMTLKGINGLDYDVADNDVDMNFESGDLRELRDYTAQHYAYVRLQNDEKEEMFAMKVYLNTFDATTIIPEGTYEINGSGEINTVQQGSIESDLSEVYPTYYAPCTEDGDFLLPLWLLRSGTVTVSKADNGQIAFEVNAKNSFERICHITYNWDGTGIRNVNAANAGGTIKMVDNQQIVIKNGDKKFNILGQPLDF